MMKHTYINMAFGVGKKAFLIVMVIQSGLNMV